MWWCHQVILHRGRIVLSNKLKKKCVFPQGVRFFLYLCLLHIESILSKHYVSRFNLKILSSPPCLPRSMNRYSIQVSLSPFADSVKGRLLGYSLFAFWPCWDTDSWTMEVIDYYATWFRIQVVDQITIVLKRSF